MVYMKSCHIAGGSSCSDDGGDPGYEIAKCDYVPDCIGCGPRVSIPSTPPRSPAVHPTPDICSNSCFSTSNIACPDKVSCPYLNTTVGGTGLRRNPACSSFLDSCAICHGAVCTCAGRSSMAADDRLREGARQVFEIALEELFIESKLGNADVKYSFPYEDTVSDPVEEAATRNGVPLRWVECFDGGLVLFRLGLLVFTVFSEQERSGRNTRFVIRSMNHRSNRNEWVKLSLLALVVPGVSALVTTKPPDGDGTSAHPDRHAHQAESAQLNHHLAQHALAGFGPSHSVQLAPSQRRELQTAVSTSADLLSALDNTGVGRIVLASGTYYLSAALSITRSVILEAAAGATVTLNAQASANM